MEGKRRKPARGVEVGERVGERGRLGRQQLQKNKQKTKEREFYYFVLISPLLLFQLDTLFFGPMTAAAQLLCVIGRLQESKEDT